jgi:hypothetical protein
MGDDTMNPQAAATLTRRDVMQRVTAMLGGAALAGGDRLLAFAFDDETLARTMTQGTSAFSAAEIALLDEIAETILPETSSPGAKAAKTGAFMALMVTDAYTVRAREVFREGMRQLDAASVSANGAPFMSASPAQRLTLLQALDREQKAVMDARRPPPATRAPLQVVDNDEPAHYFRMMKELALLGFFTSEAGCTKAMRYIEAPGRFDPCAPFAPGDKAWAAHA